MSSFVWMKFLESTPERYDLGVRLLSRGRIADIYDRIAEFAASPGKHVLDVGCGTGGAALACAARGAHVVAIDSNAGMLEVARSKTVPIGGAGVIEWLELGLAEIEDRFGEATLDAIVFCLVFSEFSPDEQAYALNIAHSRLTLGGRLVIADETLPLSKFQRAWYRVLRLPLVAATYLLTQASTRPIEHLADRVRSAGFGQVEETRLLSDTFVIVHAVRDEIVR